MTTEKLPETYKGFPTTRLLQIWRQIPYNTLDTPEAPKDEFSAMGDLLREYEIMNFRGEKGGEDSRKVARSKRLLAPFGIDPAPWADENGIRQEELEEAWVKSWKDAGPEEVDYDADFYSDEEEQ